MKELTKQEMLNLSGGSDDIFDGDPGFGIVGAIGPMDHGGGLHDLPNTDLNLDILDAIGPMDHGGG